MKNKGVLVMAKDREQRGVLWQLAVAALWQAGVAVAAALLGQVSLFGGLHPFGLAFVIAAPDRYAVAALCGFVLSRFVFDTTVTTTAYTAAAGVVAALRWILSGMARGRRRRSGYLPGLCAGLLSAGLTELSILLLSATATSAAVLRTLAGLMLCGAFSYFYRVTFEALRRAGQVGLSSAQRACLALGVCTAVMALYPVNIGVLSLGRLAAVGTAMFAAFCLSSPLDAALFASASAGIALSENGFAFAAVGIAAAGALSSLFKRRQRGVLCLVFVLTAVLFAVCGENYIFAMTYLAEVMAAALVFLLLPRLGTGSAAFQGTVDVMQSATAAMSQKIESISGAMKDVASLLERTVPETTETLDYDRLFSTAAERICRGCRNMSACWVERYDDTIHALYALQTPLQEHGSVCSADLEERFREGCRNPHGLCREISDAHRAMQQSMREGRHTAVYRSILKKQFSAVSDMLDGAKKELMSFRRWDEERSRRIFECARRLGLPVETASCVYDGDARPLVTVTLRDNPSDLLVRRLRAGAGEIVGVKLAKPVSETASGGVTLRFNAQPVYTVRTAVSQKGAEDGVCGDVYSVFSDLSGHVHLLLSDGMGTGRDAARDGAVCCAFVRRLLEAGFQVRRAAELANAAMALRVDSETASTLDVLSVNICDGTARLFKAGAAPTYCLHEGRVAKLESRSLPVGILEQVVCREMALTLSDGDVLVLTSDGVESEGPFIAELLRRMKHESAESICREISARCMAVAHRDDVTVLVVRLEKGGRGRGRS